MEGLASLNMSITTIVFIFLSVTLGPGVLSCPIDCLCYVDLETGYRTANCSGIKFLSGTTRRFPQIEMLNIQPSDNNEPVKLYDEMFIHFSKLKLLNLNKCYINNLPKSVFKGLKKIYEINLSYNHIKYFDTAVFQHIVTLHRLNLRHNPLQMNNKPYIISSSLQDLDLSYCNIYALPNEFFHGLKKVTHLNLEGNHLHTVKEHVLPRGLTQLNLARNKVVNVPIATISSLSQLRLIDLSDNPINCTCSLFNLQDRLSGDGVLIDNDVRCAYPLEVHNVKLNKVNENAVCNKETFGDRYNHRKSPSTEFSNYYKKAYFENEKYNRFDSVQGDDPSTRYVSSTEEYPQKYLKDGLDYHDYGSNAGINKDGGENFDDVERKLNVENSSKNGDTEWFNNPEQKNKVISENLVERRDTKNNSDDKEINEHELKNSPEQQNDSPLIHSTELPINNEEKKKEHEAAESVTMNIDDKRGDNSKSVTEKTIDGPGENLESFLAQITTDNIIESNSAIEIDKKTVPDVSDNLLDNEDEILPLYDIGNNHSNFSSLPDSKENLDNEPTDNIRNFGENEKSVKDHDYFIDEFEGSGDIIEPISSSSSTVQPVTEENKSHIALIHVEPEAHTPPAYVDPNIPPGEVTSKANADESTEQVVERKQLSYEALGPYIVAAGILVFITVLVLVSIYKCICKPPKTRRKPVNDVEANNGTELQDIKSSLLPKTINTEEKHNNKYPKEASSPETDSLLKESDKLEENPTENGVHNNKDEPNNVNHNEGKNGSVMLNGKSAADSLSPPIELTTAKLTVLYDSIPKTPIFVQKRSTDINSTS